MQTMKESKSIYASAVASITAIAVVVAVTIGGELSVPFKSWLKSFTGHHWTTKSWLSLIVFVVGFLIIRSLIKEPDAVRTRRSILLLIATAILGSVVLVGFFVFEYLGG